LDTYSFAVGVAVIQRSSEPMMSGSACEARMAESFDGGKWRVIVRYSSL